MLLQELFNTKFDFDDVEIVEKDDKHYEVRYEIGGRTIAFRALYSITGWDIEFSEVHNDHAGEYNTYNLSNRGSAPQVLAFIVTCIKKFDEQYKPERMIFSANKRDKSRAKVYERMLQRELKKFTHFDYEVADEGNGLVEFILTRKSK